ncbi:MAG: DUF2442 domain-containing protein [Gammaproteobacteria bacterium]
MSNASRDMPAMGPRAAKARVLARGAVLQIEMTNGVVVRLPVSLVPGLSKASPAERSRVEVAGRGGGLHWPRLDFDLSVPALVSSALEGREWMAELGRLGGRQSSSAKATAARKNGRKGGRPRLPDTAPA